MLDGTAPASLLATYTEERRPIACFKGHFTNDKSQKGDMIHIPKTQTAIVISGPGGPDVLAPREIPVETPGAGEILIRVKYRSGRNP